MNKIPFGWERVPAGYRVRRGVDIYSDNHPKPTPNDKGKMPPNGWHWIGEGLDGMKATGEQARYIGEEEARNRINIAIITSTTDCTAASSCRYYIETHEKA